MAEEPDEETQSRKNQLTMTDMKTAILQKFAGNWVPAYERFLSLEPSGKEYVALCPFHNDSTPSLTVEPATGRFYCHGCKAGGDFLKFYGLKHGLSMNGGFRQILEGICRDFGIEATDGHQAHKKDHQAQKERGTRSKTYDYTDQAGKMLFQVVRFEPKNFSQRRPDGKGGWIWSVKDLELVPYRLPEVLGATEVLVVEGEKDCQTAARLGFTATCNPMGAGKWRAEYSDHLKGKKVVLIPDNDQPGREHMNQVAASLTGKAASVKLLDLSHDWPGLPEKGDLSDWAEHYGDDVGAAERLASLVEGAPEYSPPKEATLQDAVLSEAEFLKLTIPDKRIFLNPWLTEESIALVSGWRGTGKTWFVLGILNSVTTGTPFGPWQAGEPVPALFLDGEMPVNDVKYRLKTMSNGTNRKAPLFVFSDSYASHLGLPRAHLLNEGWRQKLKQILIDKGVKLLVLDNLASLSPGIDENSKQEWDPVNQWLLSLRFAGISTVMLHHASKEGKQRGTSGREDNIDISILLKSPADYEPEDGARFTVHFSKARVRTSELPKISDYEFKLTEIEGKSIWSWATAKRKTRDLVLSMLHEGNDQKSIAEALKISKAHVSQIRKQAIHDGLMDAKNTLTERGGMAVS